MHLAYNLHIDLTYYITPLRAQTTQVPMERHLYHEDNDTIEDMAFPRPEYSKSQVDKAGDILVNSKSTQEQVDKALDILSNWRACHGYPINTFQSTLRNRLKRLKFKTAIVAQRLKRMPTIIIKLKRYKNMQLARMQDIGGLRAIVNSINDVNALEHIYLSDKNFPHDLVRNDDYIQKPKEDGYRSVHLVYKYKNKLKLEYNGLLLELQIRTKLQHIWATAVETMGTYLGQALKSGEGEQKWRDFFTIASSAFAYIEKSPPVLKLSRLDKEKTFKALAHIETDISALSTMEGYKFALNIITEKGTGSYYHLIILNSLEKRVQIKSYAKGNIKQASADYTKTEARAAKGEKIEPVLVSAGDINNLKRAYPNFFLDVQDFINRVKSIQDEIKKIN